MSARNIDLVKRVFPAEADLAVVMRSDEAIAAFVADPAALAPDLEVTFAAGQVGALGFQGRGVEGLIEGWQDWMIPWETYSLTIEEYIEAGDKVVTLVRVKARTSRDSVELEHRPAAVWTVRGDKVTAVTFFLDRNEALEFAGLEPR